MSFTQLVRHIDVDDVSIATASSGIRRRKFQQAADNSTNSSRSESSRGRQIQQVVDYSSNSSNINDNVSERNDDDDGTTEISSSNELQTEASGVRQAGSSEHMWLSAIAGSSDIGDVYEIGNGSITLNYAKLNLCPMLGMDGIRLNQVKLNICPDIDVCVEWLIYVGFFILILCVNAYYSKELREYPYVGLAFVGPQACNFSLLLIMLWIQIMRATKSKNTEIIQRYRPILIYILIFHLKNLFELMHDQLLGLPQVNREVISSVIWDTMLKNFVHFYILEIPLTWLNKVLPRACKLLGIDSEVYNIHFGLSVYLLAGCHFLCIDELTFNIPLFPKQLLTTLSIFIQYMLLYYMYIRIFLVWLLVKIIDEVDFYKIARYEKVRSVIKLFLGILLFLLILLFYIEFNWTGVIGNLYYAAEVQFNAEDEQYLESLSDSELFKQLQDYSVWKMRSLFSAVSIKQIKRVIDLTVKGN